MVPWAETTAWGSRKQGQCSRGSTTVTCKLDTKALPANILRLRDTADRQEQLFAQIVDDRRKFRPCLANFQKRGCSQSNADFFGVA